MDYEEQRLANVARARAYLATLGIEEHQPKAKAKRKPNQSKKRVVSRRDATSDAEENPEEPPRKVAKVETEEMDEGAPRRSARNRGKAPSYKEDGGNAAAAARGLPRVVSAAAQRAAVQGAPRDNMKREHDPKTYGAIPGIPIGSWWETRQSCSTDAIHAPWVAGISSGPKGAYSVALSGGYEDDVDLGEAFTFTGSGGRDLKGTKDKPKNLRTAPQSSDQTFENSYNAALLRSSMTKKPVRVIRGYKLDSPYAPAEGYRYDGLYTVEKAWMEKGLNPKKYMVCKFALKRIPGQPPLQYGDEEEEDVPSSTVENVTKSEDSDEADESDMKTEET